MEDKFGALVCGSKEMGRRQIEIESARVDGCTWWRRVQNY